MMNEEQFAQLLTRLFGAGNEADGGAAGGAAGGGLLAAQTGARRLPAFTTADPQDWIAWRIVFEKVRAYRGWEGDQAVGELTTAMQGLAARMVSDINTTGREWGDILKDYGNRFLPEAASKLARQDFKSAKQKEDETIVQWHTRIRELFLRAHPTLPTETSVELIEAFIMGLANPKVRELTAHEQPNRMARALESATNRAAVAQSLMQHDGLEGDKARIGAMQPRRNVKFPDSKGCWHCDQEGHQMRNCPKRGNNNNRGNSRRPGRGSTDNPRRGGGQFNAIKDELVGSIGEIVAQAVASMDMENKSAAQGN